MANRHKSAVKAAKQAKKREAHNRAGRSRYRTAIKKVQAALVATYKTPAAAKEALVPMIHEVQSVLQTASSRGFLKPKTASRYVARLHAAVTRVSGN